MKASRIIRGYQIETDGRTVWINAPDGMNVGRFGRKGVDVHKPTAEQAAGGHCADCFPRSPSVWADWQRFRDSVKKNHGFEVPYDFRPAESGVEVGATKRQGNLPPDDPK